MILSGDSVGRAIERQVKTEDFFDTRCRTLFETVVGLYNEGKSFDDMSLGGVLSGRNLLKKSGGRTFILECVAAPTSPLAFDFYCDELVSLSKSRGLINLGEQIVSMARGGEKGELVLSEAERLLVGISDSSEDNTIKTSAVAVNEAINHLTLLSDKSIKAGIPTGFRDFDNVTYGLQPGMFYLVAARPAMGKSSLALCMAHHIAKKSMPVVFFSLEMSSLELTNRMLSFDSGVDYRNILIGSLDKEQWQKVMGSRENLTDIPLYIDDDPRLTLSKIKAKSRKIKSSHGQLGAIFIDYLQLMSMDGKQESRQVEISEISRGLKILSKELGCPVVALSQLNRQLEYRQDKRPMLADLRESGSLEQDADVVAFLYRDEIYDPNTDDLGVAEFIIGKNRRGQTKTTRLAFISRLTQFKNIVDLQQ
jgi:replicative DNA helicase